MQRILLRGRPSAEFEIKPPIHIQADSPAIAIFDQWNGALFAAQDDLTASASIMSPSLGKAWTLNNGSLTRFKPIPDAKKIFEAQTYEITWESVQVTNI